MPIECAVVLVAVKDKPSRAAEVAVLDRLCARRRCAVRQGRKKRTNKNSKNDDEERCGS
jgi:hypothetical protein